MAESSDGVRHYSIEELIERSSLGSPGAKALRERTRKETVDRVIEKVEKRSRSGPEHLSECALATYGEGYRCTCNGYEDF